MSDEEIDFEAAVPVKSTVEKIVEHFSTDLEKEMAIERKCIQEEDKPVDVTDLVEDPMGPLEFSELCEPLAFQLMIAKAQAKKWASVEKALRDEAVRLAKDQRGSIQLGKYVLALDEKKGNTTIDWELVAQEWMPEKDFKQLLMDKEDVKRGKLDHKWVKQGKPTLNVSVGKLAQ